METFKPEINAEKGKQNLSSLVEFIKKVWEGKDFSFIKKIDANKLEFIINIPPSDQDSADSVVKKLKKLGYSDAEILPSAFGNTSKIQKISFTGEFSPEDIAKYTEELGIIE